MTVVLYVRVIFFEAFETLLGSDGRPVLNENFHAFLRPMFDGYRRHCILLFMEKTMLKSFLPTNPFFFTDSQAFLNKILRKIRNTFTIYYFLVMDCVDEL